MKNEAEKFTLIRKWLRDFKNSNVEPEKVEIEEWLADVGDTDLKILRLGLAEAERQHDGFGRPSVAAVRKAISEVASRERDAQRSGDQCPYVADCGECDGYGHCLIWWPAKSPKWAAPYTSMVACDCLAGRWRQAHGTAFRGGFRSYWERGARLVPGPHVSYAEDGTPTLSADRREGYPRPADWGKPKPKATGALPSGMSKVAHPAFLR